MPLPACPSSFVHLVIGMHAMVAYGLAKSGHDDISLTSMTLGMVLRKEHICVMFRSFADLVI